LTSPRRSGAASRPYSDPYGETRWHAGRCILCIAVGCTSRQPWPPHAPWRLQTPSLSSSLLIHRVRNTRCGAPLVPTKVVNSFSQPSPRLQGGNIDKLVLGPCSAATACSAASVGGHTARLERSAVFCQRHPQHWADIHQVSPRCWLLQAG
jgi:hypothetical protein